MTPEQRIEAFQKLVEQRPDDPFARYSLAMSYRSAGRNEDAARQFEELVRRDPRYVATYLMYGQVLESVGRHDDAARTYESGIAAANRGNNEHARSELQQALEVLRTRGAS